METCITVWHWPLHERWYDEGICNTLALVKEAGFTHINWNADAGSSYWLADPEIEFTQKIIADSGLRVHSVHASNGRNPLTEINHNRGNPLIMESRKDFMSPHEWQRRSGVELIKNRVDLAKALGSPNIVLHIAVTDEVFRSEAAEEAFLAPIYASFDDLKSYCAENNVQIAIETLFCASAESFLKLYERLFARYEGSFLGLGYDCGHWELIDPGKTTVLDQFGDRLIATHIHDNFGVKDDHLLPFDGRMDWSLITNAIATTSYKTPLNFETPMDRYGMPERAYYQRAHMVASRLEVMIERLRSVK